MKNISKKNFVRSSIISEGLNSLLEIKEFAKKSNYTLQIDQSDFDYAENAIKKDYDVDSLDEIIRKRNGKINISQMLRKMFRKDVNIPMNFVKTILGSDGIKFSDDLFKIIRSEILKEKAVLNSPDKNQDNGNRAEFKKERKKRVSKNKFEIEKSLDSKFDLVTQLLSIEDTVDSLIYQSVKNHDQNAINILKEVRRQISYGMIKISTM